MPTYDYSPDIAIASRFDARSWGSGVDLYSRITTATGVTVSTGTASLGIIHDDALAFLNGRGIYLDWAGEVNTGALLGTFTSGIDENDKVYLENDSADFDLLPRPDNAAWGFPVAGLGLVGGIAPFRQTAPDDWPRGVTTNPSTGASPLMIISDGLTTSDVWPKDRGFRQDVPTSMRQRGTAADIDDLGNDCLEILDDLNILGINIWGVDDDGHVYNDTPYYKYTSEADAQIVWIDSDLMERLGFDGTEVVDSSTFYRWRTTATHPLPGFYKPTRPLATLHIGTENVGSSMKKVNGVHYSAPINTYQTIDFNFYIDGPSDIRDTSRHWENYCMQYFHEGFAANLYQDFGDSRRAGTTRNYKIYDSTYTVEFEGYRGRLPFYFTKTPDGALNWEFALRRRFKQSISGQIRD